MLSFRNLNNYPMGEKTIPEELLHQLHEGMYLGILEDYVDERPWSLTKIARDVWQNFFDANGNTLDGISYAIQEDTGYTTIAIEGLSEYDFRRILSLGGGDKPDYSRSAGGKGEGVPFTSLLMLRDYGFEQVTYQSADWQIDFSLSTPPYGMAPRDDLRGLTATLTEQEYDTGSRVILRTSDPQAAQAFVEARDLFYYEGNPKLPPFDVDNASVALGILDPDKKGSILLNGMEVGYGSKDKFDNVPGLTILTRTQPQHEELVLKLSRDRDLITHEEMARIIIPWIAESLDETEILYLIAQLEESWEENKHELPSQLLGDLIDRVVQEKIDASALHFGSQWVAKDFENDAMADTLKRYGYRLAKPKFAELGMPLASAIYKEIGTQQEVIPNENELLRMKLLGDVADKIIGKSANRTVQHLLVDLGAEMPRDGQHVEYMRQSFAKAFGVRETKLFRGKHPIDGQYDGGPIWIARRVMAGDFFYALAVHLHERAHPFGKDASATFSATLTELFVDIADYCSSHPEEINQALDEWEKHQTEHNHWEDFSDFKAVITDVMNERQLKAEEKRKKGEDTPSWEAQTYEEDRLKNQLAIQQILESDYPDIPLGSALIKLHIAMEATERMKAYREIEAQDLSPEEFTVLKSLIEQIQAKRKAEQPRYTEMEEKFHAKTGEHSIRKLQTLPQHLSQEWKELLQREGALEEMRELEKMLQARIDNFFKSRRSDLTVAYWQLNNYRFQGQDFAMHRFTSPVGFIETVLPLFFEKFQGEEVDQSQIDDLTNFLRYSTDIEPNARNVRNALENEMVRIYPILFQHPTPASLAFAETLHQKYVALFVQ